MKKIVCIIDFTSISDNAVQYAAQLAKDTNSKLVLLWLQNKAHHVKVNAFADEHEAERPHTTRLSETCDMLRGVWGIRCDFVELPDMDEHAPEVLDSDVQLVVMGEESPASNTPYKLFSKIDFKMIRHTLVPVLLVPENFRYRKLNRILYAFDYLHDSNPPLKQLEQLSIWLKTDVRVLTVSQTEFSQEEDQLIDNRNSELVGKWHGPRALSFDSIYYHDVAECLENYLQVWRADDMIVFSIGHSTLLDRIFHKSIVQQMTLCCEYPILIIHR